MELASLEGLAVTRQNQFWHEGVRTRESLSPAAVVGRSVSVKASTALLTPYRVQPGCMGVPGSVGPSERRLWLPGPVDVCPASEGRG